MESKEHQKLLNGLAKGLEKKGTTITHIDISGTPEFFDEKYRELPTPMERDGHIPDLEGTKDGLKQLGEAKIDINNDSNIDSQLKVFANSEMKGKPVPLHVVVPENLKDDLKKKFKELQLYDKYENGQIHIWS